MSICIATPMYGGKCEREYFESCMNLKDVLIAQGVAHSFLTTANESHINRARNTSAATFLKTEFEYLMFIDGDIVFSPDDVGRLWNMNGQVTVAAYPMKVPGSPLSAWVDGRLVSEFDQLPCPCPVDYAGTGFMLIHRSVFEKMIEAMPEIEHFEGNVGRCWAFFDSGVAQFMDQKVYLSEDYWFCQKWRDMGGQILMDPTIRLGHIGRFIFGKDDMV